MHTSACRAQPGCRSATRRPTASPTRSPVHPVPRGLRGQVVYGGLGGAGDFAKIDVAGKIVLLESIANPAASLRASQAGALGQIHISPLQHLYEMCISPVWGSPTPDQLNFLPKTVVLSVRKADGDALKLRVLAGEAVEATLHAEVDTGWRKTPILEAHLDAGNSGTRRQLRHVLRPSRHLGTTASWTTAAPTPRCSRVARLFAQRRGQLKRGLRLCFWSGHSHGRYSGSSWYADAKFRELARSCVAHVNIDSVGAKGNTVLADALSSNELFPLAAEAVKQQGGQDLDGHRMSRAGGPVVLGHRHPIRVHGDGRAAGRGTARASWDPPSAAAARGRGPASDGGGTRPTTRSTRSTPTCWSGMPGSTYMRSAGS